MKTKTKSKVLVEGWISMKSKGARSGLKNMRIDELYGYCGVPTVIRTSRTKENPGRRFAGCGKYKVSSSNDFSCYSISMKIRVL